MFRRLRRWLFGELTWITYGPPGEAGQGNGPALAAGWPPWADNKAAIVDAVAQATVRIGDELLADLKAQQPVTPPSRPEPLPDVKVRAYPGINPAVAAYLAGALHQPWADPEWDVMADLHETMRQAGQQMPLRRELHCASNVADHLVAMFTWQEWLDGQLAVLGPPAGWSYGSPLADVDIVVEADMQPGEWRLQDADGTVRDSGTWEQL